MTDLAGDEAIDRDLLIGELEAARFAETELREDAWNPLDWVYLLGDGLFTAARPRVRAARRPAGVDRRPARDAAGGRSTRRGRALVGDGGRPGRPVPDRDGAQAAAPAIEELIAEALARGRGAPRRPTPASPRSLPRLAAAAATARGRHLAAFEAHLREVVLPASDGEGRLGPELFAAKMRHTMRSETLTPERILAAAEREYEAVRAEMVRLARDLWPAWCPDRPLPDDEGALVRGVLDAIAAEHPEADDLLDFCREENARIEAFCRERDLIGLADEPLEIRWTPVFLRAFGGAMLVVAGSARQGPEGVLRDHPDARRLDRGAARVEPARGQRPDAPAADHPRGGPRPLPPGRLRQPLPVARPGDLRQRPVRRGLGRLRHPGDDGRRATARTTRRCC